MHSCLPFIYVDDVADLRVFRGHDSWVSVDIAPQVAGSVPRVLWLGARR